tara:strand:- start:174 stop:614 length:441 start_codon:yes stop_codon:yes gene_type:complete
MKENEKYMKEAFLQAKKAYELDEVPVGAVVVFKKKIIVKAHNMSESLNNFTAHAELLALNQAAKNLNSKYLNQCELYVTKEPCLMCAGAIMLSRIKKLHFGASDIKKGYRFYNKNLFLNKIEVNYGILEQECSLILKDFFKLKRKK